MTTPSSAFTRARTRRARRIAGALAPAMLLTGLLAGCSSDDTPSASATGGATASSATSTSGAASATTSSVAGTFVRTSDGTVKGLSYAGQDGKTALVLLKQADPSATMHGSGKNAFVVSIGGRKADDSKHEFWALSVDGTESKVGAGSLVTKDGETISWKIATY